MLPRRAVLFLVSDFLDDNYLQVLRHANRKHDVVAALITDPREADVGSILGFGFAPFTGGALSYIDFMGAARFVELCRKLEAKHGARFSPPETLVAMAGRGGTFYGEAGKQAA